MYLLFTCLDSDLFWEGSESALGTAKGRTIEVASQFLHALETEGAYSMQNFPNTAATFDSGMSYSTGTGLCSPQNSVSFGEL